ncbi:MAG: DUF1513 domain-containing protein, partial [Burkholderiales bacterium]|nr:DUF1513 domain-containing protein [Burkholderiales bacterium]
AWRGPRASDPYRAGGLEADWERLSLTIRWSVELPGRPHGLLADEEDGLVVLAMRPGEWIARCAAGRIVRLHRLDQEGPARLCGHAVSGPGGLLLTTETDRTDGAGKVGLREPATFRKIAVWDSHGRDPHQLVCGDQGDVFVANGGVPRTPEDRKVNLHRMDASLVRLDARSGALLGQWRLADRRLSIRHLAWSRPNAHGRRLLGLALQAEHDTSSERDRAPLLAVFDGERLEIPVAAADGSGYAGDIAAASSGFVVSSNDVGLVQLWHPRAPGRLFPVVRMAQAYALATWDGPEPGGGVLVASALGLVRWHPSAKPVVLAWPEPMALDNHWIVLREL